jgi:hypothetical protein
LRSGIGRSGLATGLHRSSFWYRGTAMCGFEAFATCDRAQLIAVNNFERLCNMRLKTVEIFYVLFIWEKLLNSSGI